MEKKLKNRWVKALRSGKFVQGSVALKRKDEFGKTKHCCLGVLAEIQGAKLGPTLRCQGSYTPLTGNYKKYSGGLSCDEQGALAKMNDQGNSFKTIALYIEKWL